MKSRQLGLCAILILATGCADNLMMKNLRWSASQGPAPSRPSGVDAKTAPLSLGQKKLIFQAQKVDGVEVEGTFYKEISSNGPEFITYGWAQPLPVNLRAHLIMMRSQKGKIEGEFFKRFPEFQKKDLLAKPELIIQEDGPKWRFILQREDGTLLGVYMDRTMRITDRKQLGSSFDKPTATLYPQGPLKSRLEKVILDDLTEAKTLTSNLVKILTQADQAAEAEDNNFAFPVEDRRFHQVQAYYYISQAMDWAKKALNFQLPFRLEAETSVGFPEKTNTAFYFQKRVRLGEGDDVVFSHIPLDPSIVTHEAFHAVIDAVARLPFEGQGGSLNEGFADYFTSAALDNPNLGEASYKKAPYKRTVNNTRGLNEANEGLYHDSGIISGLFWNIQKVLGKDETVSLAWNTLLRLTPKSNFADFKVELMDHVNKLSDEKKAKVLEVLQQRGWGE